ncbi:unnamed protein product [Paramecium pentaurelia]|uniref:Uncharacterized protein n=1 Tax=Paramecium pentaurelia TaxID=43138 RepID=A0A8S1VX33_9CILI|nr:unnamed protein product [Paramecium pentaurelia]
MGQTCSCKSMLSVSNAEITRRNELSLRNDSQNSPQENYLQVEKSSRAYTTDYPQRFIIIYPAKKENFDSLRKELKHLNKDASFIIQECENLSQDSNFSLEFSSYLPSSLEDFKL